MYIKTIRIVYLFIMCSLYELVLVVVYRNVITQKWWNRFLPIDIFLELKANTYKHTVIIWSMNKSDLCWILIIHMNTHTHTPYTPCEYEYEYMHIDWLFYPFLLYHSHIIFWTWQTFQWILCKFQCNHFIDILSILFFIIIREHKTKSLSSVPLIYIFRRIDYELCACLHVQCFTFRFVSFHFDFVQRNKEKNDWLWFYS